MGEKPVFQPRNHYSVVFSCLIKVLVALYPTDSEENAVMKDKKNLFNTENMEKHLLENLSPAQLVEKLREQSLSGYLNYLMGRRNFSTELLAELSALNRSSLYRILNGKTKSPQRNVLIRLALTLRLTFQETQELLKCGCQASLSGQRGRDILISDGIIHHKSIEDVNERLLAYHFPDLYSRE